MKKRLLSGLLVAAMLLTLLPATALATDGAPTGQMVVYAGETFTVSLDGSGTSDITISGYMDPESWYVTDGLVLMYDGIYNAGMNQTDADADTWTDLTGNTAALELNGVSNGQNAWDGNGLSLKNKTGTVRLPEINPQGEAGETYTFVDGITAEMVWTPDADSFLGSTGGDYVYTFGREAENTADYGSGSMFGIRKDGVLLFYNAKHGDQSTSNFVASPSAKVERDYYAAYFTSDSDGHETAVSTNDGAAFKTARKTLTNDTLFNIGSIYFRNDLTGSSDSRWQAEIALNAFRLYDRDLTEAETAQNAAVDAARYQDGTYTLPGTVKASGEREAAALCEFDFAAHRTQTVLSDVDFGSAGAELQLTLNRAGAYTLSFQTQSGTVTRDVSVISEEAAQAADAAGALIEALPAPDAVTSGDLAAVSAAQAAYEALSELQKARVGDEMAQKLADCVETLEKALEEEGYQVTVTFDLNDADSAIKAELERTPDDDKIPYLSSSFQLPVPTRALYTFLGWYDGDLQVTDGAGLAQIAWEKLYDTALTAHWQPAAAEEPYQITSGAQIYALARILAKAPKDDQDSILTAELKADYALFGVTEQYADGYAALQTASYEVAADGITLNAADDRQKAFTGIPNFSGTWDGMGRTIEVAFDLTGHTAQAAGQFGCLFASLSNATVRNLTLQGSVTGQISCAAGLQDMGVLAGATANTNAISNVICDVDVTLQATATGTATIYFGALVGRANAAGDGLKLDGCVNRGTLKVDYIGFTQNGGSRLGGLVGHAYSGVAMTGCSNEGDLSSAGSDTKANVGGLAGTGSVLYTDCVQSGNIVGNGYRIYAFTGMERGSSGNVIQLTVTGEAGQEVAYPADASQTQTLGTEPISFRIPVDYENGVVENNGFAYGQSLQVNGTRLDWYNLTSTALTARLNTAQAAPLQTPFQSWDDALEITTAQQLLAMQKAINDGDSAAIAALYELGGRAAPENDEEARMTLQTAYYKLGADITVDDAAFTGIGNAAYPFGGHLDGQNHTVDLTLSTAAAYTGLFGYLNLVGGSAASLKDLNLNCTIEVELTAGDYYIGALAGRMAAYACEMDHVTVEVQGIEVTGAAAGKVVYVGGLLGEGKLMEPGAELEVRGAIEVNAAADSLYVGGALGGGGIAVPVTVRYCDGAALRATNAAGHVILGGLIGYCPGDSVDLRGSRLVNETGQRLTFAAESTSTGAKQNVYAGGWVGNLTAATAASDDWLYVDGTTQSQGEFGVSAKSAGSQTMAGGVVGFAATAYSLSIRDYENEMAVTSSRYAGGLAGMVTGSDKRVELTNCANHGDITGGSANVGGLIGYLSFTSGSTADGSVRILDTVNTGTVRSSGTYTGGLIGGIRCASAVLDNCVNTGGVYNESESSAYLGGLAGSVQTALTLQSSANGGALQGGGRASLGGLVGQMNAAADLSCAGSLYLKTDEISNAVGAPAGTADPAGAAALDTAALCGDELVFGTPIEALTETAPAALRAEGDAVLSGRTVQYTRAGAQVEATFCWGDLPLLTVTAAVSPLDVSDAAEIAGLQSAYVYTGAAITPEITVVYNDTALLAGTDYTVQYSGNQEVGTAQVKVLFQGNYTGTAAATFEIAAEAPLEVAAEGYTGVYDAQAHTISVTAPEGAEVYYALAQDGVYDQTAPAARTDAGTSVVWYQATLDGASITGSAVISIAPRPLTITADSLRVEQGGEAPVYTYTADGLAGDDAVGSVQFSCDADLTVAGLYPITPSQAVFSKGSADNYQITYAAGTLTVYTKSSGHGATAYAVVVSDTRNGTVEASPKRASRGTAITVTVTPDSGYALEELTARGSDGSTIQLSRKGEGQYGFTMPACRVTIEASFVQSGETGLPFTDVPAGAYYCDAVKWAVEQDITSGVSETAFAPDAACTRAQMVVFLWRAAGAPEPQGETTAFADVSAGAYYYDAVLWAAEQGIAKGTSETAFSPNRTVSRAQVAAFLYRAAGAPAVSGSSGFADVPPEAYYADAVKWAADAGITTGTGDAAFRPDDACTRGQIVTFLYRAAQ